MVLEILKYVSWGLGVLAAGLAGYLGGYFKKKGEDRAIQENFNELLRQTVETTERTKGIEAKISTDVWSRQKRWELKREVLFEATKRVALVVDRLKTLANVLQTELKNPGVKAPDWAQMKIDANEKWFEATAGLDESRIFVGVSCSKNTLDALVKFGQLTTRVAAQIHNGDGEIFKRSVPQLFEANDTITDAIRKELAIDGGGS